MRLRRRCSGEVASRSSLAAVQPVAVGCRYTVGFAPDIASGAISRASPSMGYPQDWQRFTGRPPSCGRGRSTSEG